MNNLDELASFFCDGFFEARKHGNPGSVISLFGESDSFLSSLKQKMEEYILLKEEDVIVLLGRKGYTIDVGSYLGLH